LDLDDLVHIAAGQAVEQDDFIQPVEEFRPEMAAHRLHHLGAAWLSSPPSSPERNSVPRLEVRMITVLRKSTVRPCPSVSRPSSRTWSNTLKTSGWAFSTSSNRIT